MRAHLGWIIFDCVLSIIVLVSNLAYGTYDKNPIKTVELLQNFNNFLTVIIFHGVVNGVTLCFMWGSGKEPYDFLWCSCVQNSLGAVFHLAIMAVGGIFIIWGIHNDFFCPWTELPVHVEFYSYIARAIVVTIFGLIPGLAKLCHIQRA